MAEAALAALDASMSVASQGKGGKGRKGGGSRRREDPDNSMEAFMGTLAKLAISHEYAIIELKDINGFVFLVYEKEVTRESQARREQWRKPKPESGPHPCGLSLRGIMRAVLMKAMNASYVALEEHPEKAAVEKALDYLMKCAGKEAEKIAFRLRPKYPKPLEDPQRPWVWELVLSREAPQEAVEALFALSRFGARRKVWCSQT
jgi:hypothetical protein